MSLYPSSLLPAGVVLLGFLQCVGVPCLAEEPPSSPFELRNGQWMSEHLLVGGQPDSAQLDAMHAAGIRSIINLRGLSEMEQLTLEGFDEAKQAEYLGLPYLHIPISGADDLDAEAARQMAAWLENEENLPAFVHCASSNRVGALFAFKAFYLDGHEVGESLRIGRAHGMSSLYEAVAERLSEAAPGDPPERR